MILSQLKRLFSFSLVGGLCTWSGLTANFVLLTFFNTPLQATYFGVYSANIMLSYYLNTKYTFKPRHRSPFHIPLYFGIYSSSMALGLLLLTFFSFHFSLPKWCFPVLVLPFTHAWNFTWSSILLGSQGRGSIHGVFSLLRGRISMRK